MCGDGATGSARPARRHPRMEKRGFQSLERPRAATENHRLRAWVPSWNSVSLILERDLHAVGEYDLYLFEGHP